MTMKTGRAIANPVPSMADGRDHADVGGDDGARTGSGINICSISLHPGRQARAANLGHRGIPRVEHFDEPAVMVDTFAGSISVKRDSPPRTRRTPGPGPTVRGRRRRRPSSLLLQLSARPLSATQRRDDLGLFDRRELDCHCVCPSTGVQ